MPLAAATVVLRLKKKFWQSALVLTAALGVSHGACAADWWFVPADPDQDRSAVVYVERSSMLRVRGTGTVTAQVWSIHRADQEADFGSYRSGKIRLTVDCEKREYGPNSGTFYSSFGGVVHQFRNLAPDRSPIQPQSLQDVAASFMCSDGKHPTRSLPVYDPNRDAEQRFLQYERDQKSRPPGGVPGNSDGRPR